MTPPMSPVTITNHGADAIEATTTDSRGRHHYAGYGLRRARFHVWRVWVGHGEWWAFTRWGARRLLYRAAVDTLSRQAITRADLETYRPGFDDRMRKERGWR